MRVLLVEDDELAALALSDELKALGNKVDHAVDASSAYELGSKQAYDAMIVDRLLPDADGLQIVERLRSAGNSTPIMILSARTKTDDRVTGLRTGADAYLNKPCDFSEVLAQLEAIVRRSKIDRQTRLVVGDLTLDLLNHVVERAGVRLSMLPREFQLLRELARHADSPVSRQDLYRSIWGYRFDPGTSVLEVHIARLRSKLGKGGSHKPLIHTVRGIGYCLSASPPQPASAR